MRWARNDISTCRIAFDEEENAIRRLAECNDNSFENKGG